MDRSEVKKIVEDHFKFMKWDMQLQKWEIEVSFDANDDSKAICSAEPNYHRAYINIDPSRHESAEDVVESLKHEMIHVLHCPFETYRKAVAHHLDEESFDALDEVFVMASEHTRSNIDNMLRHGYKLSVGRQEEVYDETVSPYDEESNKRQRREAVEHG